MSTIEAIQAKSDWVIEPGQEWVIHLLYGGGTGGPYVVEHVQDNWLGSQLVSMRNAETGKRTGVSSGWMRRPPESGRTHWERLSTEA